jgi:hypothetical protein
VVDLALGMTLLDAQPLPMPLRTPSLGLLHNGHECPAHPTLNEAIFPRSRFPPPCQRTMPKHVLSAVIELPNDLWTCKLGIVVIDTDRKRKCLCLVLVVTC